MGNAILMIIRLSSVLSVVLLVGCGTSPPKDFGGRWKPVNRFAAAPAEIPLYSSYVFQASPHDQTLKKMLGRWADDNGLKLDYKLLSDYTLYRGIADLNTTSSQDAAAEVSSAYAAQSVHVSIDSAAITVSSAATSSSDASTQTD